MCQKLAKIFYKISNFLLYKDKVLESQMTNDKCVQLNYDVFIAALQTFKPSDSRFI